MFSMFSRLQLLLTWRKEEDVLKLSSCNCSVELAALVSGLASPDIGFFVYP